MAQFVTERQTTQTMTYQHVVMILIVIASIASGGERLFTSGPQEFAGRRYYWLADWKLEVTLPKDTAEDDRFEVLFGTKGSDKRTLYFEYEGETGSMAHAGQGDGFTWTTLPLGRLTPGKTVLLYGKGRDRVAFLAGVRVTGESNRTPQVKTIRTVPNPQQSEHAATWAKLPGFELNSETTHLWDLAPRQPDWHRARRSARYAGIALSKVQRWLHEQCLAVHDRQSGLFRPTGRDRLWGVHKLEANTVRTVLIHTMLHTRNTIARPWQQGLQLGAAPCADGICIYMESDKPYTGLLQLD